MNVFHCFWETLNIVHKLHMHDKIDKNLVTKKYIYIQGLNFRAGWRDSRLKFRNPVEENRQGGRHPPKKILGFPETFCFYATKFPVSKKFVDFQTLDSVRGYFLLPIRGDSFSDFTRN